ncbi:MAG: hypothetical protein F4058_04415 [Rhodothermaceae bacterium]|nr:hypothetical protein [Rhodothermaceae bacterium]MYI84563.1 hypothetical protein [Rhodothermaceae bacterium]
MSLSSKKVVLLNKSKTRIHPYIELNRMLDTTAAFTGATRALVSDMCAKGYNPYYKRSADPAKRPMKAAWEASDAVVHFTLHHSFSRGGAVRYPPPPAYALQESLNAQDTPTSSSPKR